MAFIHRYGNRPAAVKRKTQHGFAGCPDYFIKVQCTGGIEHVVRAQRIVAKAVSTNNLEKTEIAIQSPESIDAQLEELKGANQQ